MAEQQVILVVEDSPEDFEATTRVLRKSGLANPIFGAATATRRSISCSSAGPTAILMHAPRPSVILLDLNLPGTDGRDVLTEIKNE